MSATLSAFTVLATTFGPRVLAATLGPCVLTTLSAFTMLLDNAFLGEGMTVPVELQSVSVE